MGPEEDDAADLGPLTHDQLTRDVWLWQRARGHRFSSDDLVTALIAAAAVPAPTTATFTPAPRTP